MSRRGYVVALAVAVAALVGSMGVAAAYAIGHHEGGDFGPSAVREAEGPGFGPGGGREGMGPGGGYGPGMGGGMGRWGDSGGDATVSLTQARSLAQAWVDKNAAGATLDSGFEMPMGYVFTVTKDNAVVARIMVNDDTGALMVRTATDAALTPSGTA